MKKGGINPYLSGLIILALLSAIFVYLFPLNKSEIFLSAGKLSSAHTFLKEDCSSCHEQPFEKITDQSCRKCHNTADHPANKNSGEIHKTVSAHKCTDCHGEHNGPDRLITKESAVCQSCHADIRSVDNQAESRNILNIEDHPDFKSSAANMKPSALVDTGTIKLNHYLHLRPELQGKSGKVKLDCADCHHTEGAGGSNFLPVSFDRDCRSCHPLAFDDRFKGSEVPHGNSDNVLRFLISEYSKLFPDQETGSAGRSLPGSAAAQKPLTGQQYSIQNESRRSEEQLFTKTACQLCHNVQEQIPDSLTQSRYKIDPAAIKDHWLTRSDFNHTKHLNIKGVSCNSCHEHIGRSKETKDVNLPEFKQCIKCHIQQGSSMTNTFKHFNLKSDLTISTVPSDCVMCHSYH